MQKFYVDTNIWLDYFQNKSDGLRPLGKFAFQFFKKCVENKRTIIYSDLVENELCSKIKLKDFHDFLNESRLCFKVQVTKDQFFESKKILRENQMIPLNDIIHAVLARDNLAIIITRDKHFAGLTFIAESKSPEEVIF